MKNLKSFGFYFRRLFVLEVISLNDKNPKDLTLQSTQKIIWDEDQILMPELKPLFTCALPKMVIQWNQYRILKSIKLEQTPG